MSYFLVNVWNVRIFPCKISVKDKIFDVEFSEPIRGVAPGQSAVFYDKNICLGGGIISKSA